MKNANEINVNQVYYLDLGSLAPVEVKVLKIINEKEILVEYLKSWHGRTEILPIELF